MDDLSDGRRQALLNFLSGGKVGPKYGGTRWSAERDLGWTAYGPIDRLNYGTSPYTKAVVGPVLFGGTTVDGFDGEGRQ